MSFCIQLQNFVSNQTKGTRVMTLNRFSRWQLWSWKSISGFRFGDCIHI